MKTTRLNTHRGMPLQVSVGPFSELEESARHYILDTWIRRHGRNMDADSKMKDRLRKRFTRILALPTTSVAVARFGGDTKGLTDRIVGWCAFGGIGVIHYVYVRGVYRHGGAGHVLLRVGGGPAKVLNATHWSKKLPENGMATLEDGTVVLYVGGDAT